MNLKPLPYKLFVEIDQQGDLKSDIIHIPIEYSGTCYKGEVLAIGEGVEGIEVGDQVIMQKQKGVEVELRDGVDRVVIGYLAEDLLAKVE